MSEQQELSEYGIVVPRRRMLLFETLAVGGVFIAIPIFFSLSDFAELSRTWVSYHEVATNLLYFGYSLAQASLLLFVMWASGDDLASFGFVPVRLKRDITIFLTLAGVGSAMYFGVRFLTSAEDVEMWKLVQGWVTPKTVLVAITAVLQLVAASALEEMLHRGYVIPRVTELMGSKAIALLVSSVLFGTIHLYQGLLGAVLATAFGFISGGLFLKGYSVWPLMAGHAVLNLLILFMTWPM